MDTNREGDVLEPFYEGEKKTYDEPYDALNIGLAREVVMEYCRNGLFDPTSSVVEVLEALQKEKLRLLKCDIRILDLDI